ncbi:MAG: TIGR04222 domain-containing membrane protein [Acidobacteriota bacterium]
MTSLFGPWLDLPGPEFLAHYLGLGLIVAALSVSIRRFLPSLWHSPAAQSLDGYELALLAGGPLRVCQAAVAGLRHDSRVNIEGKTLGCDPDPDPETDPSQSALSHGVERATLDAARLGSRGPELQNILKEKIAHLKSNLVEKGYWLDGGPAWAVRLLMVLPVLLWLFLGLAKLDLGIDRGRPVGFLITILAASAVGLVLFSRGSIRTGSGWRVLKRERSKHRRHTASSAVAEPTAVMMSVALFGIGWNDPLRSFFSASSSTGDGAGCGAGYDGGGGDAGGCGGGCGGCGGCGG